MQRTLIIQILAAALGAYLAGRKGRNSLAWGLAAFIFPPLAIIPAILPPIVRVEDIRRCPQCSAPMLKGTEKCPRCGESMPIDMVECGSCGKFVPEGKRCSECGSPLGN